MTIKEILEQLDDILSDLKYNAIHLYEMTQPHAQIRQRFRDLSEEIILHLIKIILYGKEETKTIPYWCSEIDAWLDKCMRNKIKKEGKDHYPNEKEILQWLTDYYKNSSDIEGLRYSVEKEYMYQGHAKRDITDEELYAIILTILKELSPLVAEKKQNKNNLQEILERYILA